MCSEVTLNMRVVPPAGRRVSIGAWRWAAAVVLSIAAGAGSTAWAQEAESPAPEPQGATAIVDPVLTVSSISLDYGSEMLRNHPGLPALGPLMDMEIPIGRVGDAFAGPTMPDVTEVGKLRLSDITEPTQFRLSAIQAIIQHVVRYFNQERVYGVFGTPDPTQLYLVPNEPVRDLRAGGDQSLRILVWVGVVKEARTVADGERIAAEQRINNPAHSRILENSPVRPREAGDPPRIDLIDKDGLDNYMFRLNRHPRRSVDVAVGAGAEPGTVSLDYLVREAKPWIVYVQGENTGTESTSDWREKFGFSHFQLTGNDDIFAVEYTTTGFDDVHAVSGSYEAPFFDSDVLRWRGYGSWSEFTASEVGLSEQEFFGEETVAGVLFLLNVYQNRDQFVDLFAGVRYMNVNVENTVGSLVVAESNADFMLPEVGVKFEQVGATSQTFVSGSVEWNVPHLAGTDDDDLDSLGRLFVDADWQVFRWDAAHTFYLEPLIHGEKWKDLSTPETSTLAYEVALRFRGQTTFDNDRMIPQSIMPIGGMHTVRGYEESVTSGDNAFIFTTEFRYHVPRGFSPEPQPRLEVFGEPFRVAPQRVLGPTDWDLILRTFIDVGRITHNDRQPFEANHTLVGVGVGAELVFKQNFSARVDWGFALREVQTLDVKEVEDGSSQVHLSFLLLY